MSSQHPGSAADQPARADDQQLGAIRAERNETGVHRSVRNHPGTTADNVGMNVPRVFYVENDPHIARDALRRFQRLASALDVLHTQTLDHALDTLRSSPRFDGYIVDWCLDRGRTCEPLLATIRGLDPLGLVCIFTGNAHDPEICRAAWGPFRCALMPRRAEDHAWRGFFRAIASELEARRDREARIAERAAANELTPRELLILHGALDGATDRGMALALGIGDRRVRTLLNECAQKLGASNVEEMLRMKL